MAQILLLEGDGIGPEVVGQTVRVIEWFNANAGTQFTLDKALIGGAAIDAENNPLPQETITKAKAADAVLLGAVGGPKWEKMDFAIRPERGLLGIRKELGLFANLRPAVVFDALVDASTLKPEVVKGLDIMIVRELMGDMYFGTPRGVETLADGTKKGVNTLVYTSPEVERIARVAFELARKRNNRVCSIDKANVLEATEMWRDVTQAVHDADYTDVELTHMYVDNAAMQLVRNPRQFDVIVTTNMFGDILSDQASMLTGSLGMLPSASLGAKEANGKQPALYEPVHGSAPDIAGKGLANPLATILSFAMMLRYSFNLAKEADLLEAAVKKVLQDGFRTADIWQEGTQKVGTTGMGDAVLQALDSLAEARKAA